MLNHNKKSKFMLIECDIRNFKFINQNYGVKQADKLIRFYSKQLNKITNEIHGIIGRGFADHFYILTKVSSVHKAMTVFKKQNEIVLENIKKHDIPFFPKYGISFLMPDTKNRDKTIQSLIGQASFAKSTIKDNHLTSYSIYNSKLLEKINEENFIENSMEEALQNKEFFVLYQPKISLSTDKIVGAEALVRWNSPKMGLLSPDRFIPLFKRHNVPAKYVQLELLERSFMDSDTMKEIINALHKEGFSVAMDDFGSGESSLNILSQVPVDVLKFDREFLLSSTNEKGELDRKTAKFIQILIELSKHLEKETVFEGVETEAQRDFLKSVNCDQAQGFFYSKPLSEQDFLQFAKLHL